jgi:glutamate racemase
MLEQAKELYRNNGTKTVVLAIGAVVLAPTIFSLLKPVAKATIKTGVILYQKGKETLAETGEQLGDLVAEAKAEVIAEQSAKQNLSLPEISDSN